MQMPVSTAILYCTYVYSWTITSPRRMLYTCNLVVTLALMSIKMHMHLSEHGSQSYDTESNNLIE